MEKFGRGILYLVLLISLAMFVVAGLKEQRAKLTSPISHSLGNLLRRGPFLNEVVNQALEGSAGDYSIAIQNLKTGEVYYKDEHKSYQAASLYKLWVMAEVYKQIEQGKLKEDQSLSADIATLNQTFNIDPDTADLTYGTITLSVSEALNQMITISHNYAALLLTDAIKISTLKDFLTESGFKESSLDPPTTTAYDIAFFYEKLYKGELANKEDTQKMIDLLKKQQLNNKLPKNLPLGTIVAHKTGEIDNFSHDGGIVYTPRGDYIIVVLSQTINPPGADDKIGQVSKAVYDYFSQ